MQFFLAQVEQGKDIVCVCLRLSVCVCVRLRLLKNQSISLSGACRGEVFTKSEARESEDGSVVNDKFWDSFTRYCQLKTGGQEMVRNFLRLDVGDQLHGPFQIELPQLKISCIGKYLPEDLRSWKQILKNKGCFFKKTLAGGKQKQGRPCR